MAAVQFIRFQVKALISIDPIIRPTGASWASVLVIGLFEIGRLTPMASTGMRI
jgi:hypothetical protein